MRYWDSFNLDMFRNLFILALFLCLFLLLSHTLISYSDGPPASHTGAPGELTCYNGRCHNSFLLNSGDASLRIDSDVPGSGYVPGRVYTISPSIRDSGMRRFGFEMLAYSEALGKSVGAFLSTDSTRTQLKHNTMNGREYIQHDSALAAIDSASWNFGWKAPDSLVGEITFYAAFVAANNNQQRQGDYVFTHTTMIREDTLRVGVADKLNSLVRIFSDPHTNVLRVWGEIANAEFVQIKIRDLQGRLLLSRSRYAQVGFHERISTHTLSRGIYLTEISIGNRLMKRKIMIY